MEEATKPLPLTVSVNPPPPAVAVLGDNVLTTGAGFAAVTVNPATSVLLVPPGFVTVTFRAPGEAVTPTANVAVSCVPDATVTLLTVMPAPALTDAPMVRPVPVMVTPTVVPCAALAGLTPVMLRAGGVSAASAWSTRIRGFVIDPPDRVSVIGTPVACSA